MARLRNGKAKDSDMERIIEFPLLTIEDDKHLSEALQVLESMMDQPKRDAGEDADMDTLAELVETYEDDHHSIPPASDADMVQHLLNTRGMSQAELHRQTGISKSSISERLKGNKSFTKDIVGRLADCFGVDRGILAANF